jgi:hypothetical protein
MGGINVPRWIAGGLVAGFAMFVGVMAPAPLLLDSMQAELEPRHLSFSLSAWPSVLLATLIAGLALVFLYAAARARFGAGAKTATIVGIAAWFFGPVVSAIILAMLGVFGGPLLLLGLAMDLIILVAASLLGAWIYREGERVKLADPAAA